MPNAATESSAVYSIEQIRARIASLAPVQEQAVADDDELFDEESENE